MLLFRLKRYIVINAYSKHKILVKLYEETNFYETYSSKISMINLIIHASMNNKNRGYPDYDYITREKIGAESVYNSIMLIENNTKIIETKNWYLTMYDKPNQTCDKYELESINHKIRYVYRVIDQTVSYIVTYAEFNTPLNIVFIINKNSINNKYTVTFGLLCELMNNFRKTQYMSNNSNGSNDSNDSNSDDEIRTYPCVKIIKNGKCIFADYDYREMFGLPL